MTVEYTREDDIAWIRLNRPDRLNAVVPALVDDLLAALAAAESDAARVIVLAGRGRSFCAGHDLREREPDEDAVAARARLENMQEVTRRIRRFPGAVIAAVHGYALGAGCEFALCCDLVVAAQSANFGFPEVGVGLSVTGGISRLLPLAVGAARAKELILLGDRFDAATAARFGLVNRVVPDGCHERAADELARRLAERPATALGLAKFAIDQGPDSSLEAALATEVDHAVITRFSPEAQMGRAAFNNRRVKE